MDTNPAHVELPLILLIKETSTGKSDVDNVKLKIRRDPKSSTLHRYEFGVPLFDHGKPEQFLFFVQNFQMNLASTGTLETEEKGQYLCTIVYGEALRQLTYCLMTWKRRCPHFSRHQTVRQTDATLPHR